MSHSWCAVAERTKKMRQGRFDGGPGEGIEWALAMESWGQRAMARAWTLGLMIVATLIPSSVGAWGEVGHEIINRAAARASARSAEACPAWLRGAEERLVDLAYEPDRWRIPELAALNRAAAPDHYIDWELARGIDPKKPPPDRYAYARALRAEGAVPAKVGFAPYRVVELCQRLEAGVMRWQLLRQSAKRDEQALRRIESGLVHTAGILGHYVGDLANPHHTTKFYNGWTGANPEGFATDTRTHWRFESDFVTRVRARLAGPSLAAAAKGELDYARAAWSLVLESNGLTRALYRLDRDGAFARGREATAVAGRGVAFARQRMARAAALLRDLWLTAHRRGLRRARVEARRRALERRIEAAGFQGLNLVAEIAGLIRVRGRLPSLAAARRLRRVLRGERALVYEVSILV